jgi:accessory gene regulator B
MITSVAQSMASYLFKNKIIDGKKLDIYIYGFEVILSNTLNILIAVVLGIIFSQIIEVIIFLAVFILLRRYCGGYHAETYLKCNIAFAINIFALMMILKFADTLPFFIHLIIVAVSVLTVIVLAPIENKHKLLTDDEKKSHKSKAIILVAIISVIVLIFLNISEYYSVIIDLALLSVAVSMIIEYFKKGRGNYEKHKNGNA